MPLEPPAAAPKAPSRTFRYLLDPLFLACLGMYAANRFLLKPLVHGGSVGAFLYGSLNDIICISFWVPIQLWLMRRTGLRAGDGPPEGMEVLAPLALWSWWFELVLPRIPRFHHLAACDPNDILCYTLGALAAALIWRWFYRLPDGRARQRRSGSYPP